MHASVRTRRWAAAGGDPDHHRPCQRGVPVTVTSLSYWRSGRRQPDDPQSLTALAQLDQVLPIAVGSLIGLLGHAAGRKRRPAPCPIRFCRPGRVAHNRGAGVLVTEWLVDEHQFHPRHSGRPTYRLGRPIRATEPDSS